MHAHPRVESGVQEPSDPEVYRSKVPGVYGSKDPGVLWSKGAGVESRVYRSDGPGVQGCVCWGFVGLWRVGLGSFGLG